MGCQSVNAHLTQTTPVSVYNTICARERDVDGISICERERDVDGISICARERDVDGISICE